MRSILLKALIALVALVVLAAAVVAWLNLRDEPDLDEAASPPMTPELIKRGEYLARAGNCEACHTARGGTRFAGGVGIETPFGIVFGTNLTPDTATGLGRWSAAQFWRAMHNGRSRDGRLLYPAFPYPNFTHVTRADADALYAYLKSLPPVQQPNRPHALRFPYDSQAALAVWRAMFFRPGSYAPDPAKPADWNRGSYLVRGLGHCDACHASRNWFGATTGGLELGGGLIPMQKWYAPSLASSQEAGVADWPLDDVIALLKNGIAAHASVQGPMAEVVYRSTQYLTTDDVRAMAVFPAWAAAIAAGEPAARGHQTRPGADAVRRQALRAALRPVPWRQWRGHAQHLSGTGGQSRRHHGPAREPRAHRGLRRLRAVHRRLSASLRHAALQLSAGRQRDRHHPHLHPRLVGQRRPAGVEPAGAALR
jgi:mono/diheme cytochrome c family protein